MWIRLLTFLGVSFLAVLACNKQSPAESPDGIENQDERSDDDTEDAIEDAAQETQDELDGNPTTE